ncbi:hypothetical protein BDV18DRAFT_155612 [Aspergillus unguis]
MKKVSLLKMLFGAFLLALLLAQVLAASVPEDLDVVSTGEHTLESRVNIKKLFKRKAKRGSCNKSCQVRAQGVQQPVPAIIESDTQHLTQLEMLWNQIGDSNLVQAGNVKHWDFDMTQSAVYGTSEIIGCTVVVVADVRGVAIGHFREEHGDQFTLDNTDLVNKWIIEPLQDQLDLVDWTDQAVAYIVHSRKSATKGLNMIRQYLIDENLPEDQIHEKQYTSGLATVGSRGKVVVTWEVLGGQGAELGIFIQNDEPDYVREFDQEGDPCELGV